MDEEIRALRDKINEADNEILKQLALRRKFSAEIARAKDVDRSPIRDQKREEDLLVRLIRLGREQGLDAHYVTTVFHEIIEDSIRLQQEYLQRLANREGGEPEVIRVAFQGIEGAYSYLAAKKFFSGFADRFVPMGLPTFAEVVKAVENGQADYAMLPIENTTSGGINEVYDLLLHTRLSIVGEEKYRVSHCLVALKDVTIGSIRKIYSHPQPVAQCSNYLATLPGCKIEYFTDTAMSVAKIKEDGDPTHAAIASEEAARLYDVVIVKRDIANQKENFTRFLVAARNLKKVDLRIPCKTSIVMATAQKPGALVEALLVFRQNGLNLTKIESRPILGNPWEEMFYLDFEGNIDDEKVQQTLEEIRGVTRFLKVLGSYPSQDLPRTSLTPQAMATVAAPQEEKAPRGENAKGAAASIAQGAPGPISSPQGCRLASRAHKPDDTIIKVRGVPIGGAGFVVIAGPCAVESYEQIMTCAREAKERGAQILRGGCFKPRTSPSSFHGRGFEGRVFEGLGLEGLEYLVEAGRAFNLPIITEVLSPTDVEAVAKQADILQVGARNMQNFSLLKEVGRVHRPVLLKRGLMSSIDELLQAAEYILEQGNQQVLLCERGIRTFETATRHTLDLGAIPKLKSLTHLPVVVDPSHAAGERDLVPPLALAAKAVGSHGIMIEIHPDPEKALSDGPQALTFLQFETLMKQLFKN
ncbi:MAG: 3-deoxy-7-phosphoheptulonate synthase [Planctomycetes bacterium]|nr:3-deoxy-7-phosphoheptulonate synthase [Planctomycetota bacterium]